MTGFSTTTTSQGGLDIAFSATSLDEMLVDLHDANKRYLSGQDQGGALRERVVGCVTEILKVSLSASERDMVSDILTGLLRHAEHDLRESVSHRLCMMPGVPEDVVLQLAHDVISVASPVLEHSPVLTDDDLLYIIQSKGADYWRAMARRAALGGGVVDMLASKKDEQTALGLLQNKAIRLGPIALGVFTDLSKYSNKLASPLLNRREVPAQLAMELYWHVSVDLRAQIVKNFKLSKHMLDGALQDALNDFKDTAAGAQNPRPSTLMVDIAGKYGAQNRLSDSMLISTLRKGQVRFFVALFAERSGLNHHTVHEMMRQVGGQALAITARAMNIKKENFVSLFLLSRSLTRGDQAVSAHELRRALKHYDAVGVDRAIEILASSIAAGSK